MQMNIHNVTKIELVTTFVENAGSRTLRITAEDYDGNPVKFEVTVYGETGALDALPRSDDFTAYDKADADAIAA